MGKRALITGITGQDGSYLAELLLAKGYEVHGLLRRTSSVTTGRIAHLTEQLHLHYGDMADGGSLRRVVQVVQPTEVYNLAAQSHVRVSFEQPEYTADIVATGALRLLNAVRECRDRTGQEMRFYQAGSSEMFGASPPLQNEQTPFHPRSPYAAAKVAAHWYAVNHREAYGLFVCNGLLFNHESPRRGEEFVTRKITRAVTRIKEGLQEKLFLGNLDARRDWGFAGDYVEAMWRMLQQPEPGDYVIGTGIAHSVQEFLEEAFAAVELDWRAYVQTDSRLNRPTEVHHLVADPRKARKVLGWRPSVTFRQLVRLMIEQDAELARQEKILQKHQQRSAHLRAVA
jgi:GDPmannose 4,6-dehydratase